MIVLLALTILSSLTSASSFEDWAIKMNKHYSSAELLRRKAIYNKNSVSSIENRVKRTYNLGRGIAMSKVSTSISIDTDVKGKAQELFADFPNADTIATMKEAEEMRKRPETYKRYSSFSELLEEIEDHA